MLDGESILSSMNKQLVGSKGVWMYEYINPAYSLAIRLTTNSHWQSEGREKIYPKICRVKITAIY
jgi:hypothetical protein